eukprot:TRINITY_DN466_c0_g1_i1.p1 TRINITY_DN466_c0_g1~~TRINITY_DN466_c0_g1_i1.p1  ORF type:complete len:132 (-),score=18.31 TRINITY_DN466_c0_g1_i1:26-421(-)
MEELKMGNILFRAFDLGGNIRERSLWASYFPLINAVVYVVDIADKERIAESKECLHNLFIQDCLDVPFLILANKIDLPDALSPGEVCHALDLDKVLYCRKIHVAMVSLAKKQGIQEAFEWLKQEVSGPKAQ